MAGLRRDHNGITRWQNDCAVQTFAEITGASYEEAAEVLKEHGFRPLSGTPTDSTRAAFESAGFKVIEMTRQLKLDEALKLSVNGRTFFVSGYKGKKGHAWSLVDGTANRAYQPPFRYQLFEVA